MTDVNQARPTGRWFDEYSLGQRFKSVQRTVTEADVNAFAELSGDRNPIHVDEAHARRSVFRQRIAHGMLVESIATGLAHETGLFEGTISALAEIEIQFRKPVFFGDTLRLELEVIEIDPEPGPKRGRIRFATTVLKQTDDLVLEGSWSVVFLRDRSRPLPNTSKEASQ